MRACLAALLLSTSPALAQEPPPAAHPRLLPEIRAVKRSMPTEEELRKQADRVKNLPPEEVALEAEAMERRIREAPPPEESAEFEEPTVDPAQPRTEPEQVAAWARRFFSRLLEGDARGLVQLSALPFQLEGQRLHGPEELFQEWNLQLRSRRTDLLTLYGIEVLTPQEMEDKYGRPPGRLSALQWRGSKVYLAVANLSGRAAVAVLRDPGDGAWRVVGFHD